MAQVSSAQTSTSGRLIREKMNTPKLDNAISPAYSPPRAAPNARRAKASINRVSASTLPASGTRVAAVETPKTFIDAAIIQ